MSRTAVLDAHLGAMRGQQESVPTVLRLTADAAIAPIAADVTRYFDADGLLLLRKSLVARIEPLLTGSQQTRRGPLVVLARVFRRWQSDSAARSTWQERWVLRAMWLACIARAVALPLWHGVVLKRQTYSVGVPNKWGLPAPGRLHTDLLPVDRARIPLSDVVVLAEGRAFVEEYRALGCAVLNASRGRIHLVAWFSDVLPRLVGLATRRIAGSIVRADAWLGGFASWELAWRSLQWEAIASAATIRVISDVEEQNPAHALKTAVFARRGGRTLRLPHTQPDTPGNHTAFWMYHVVAVSSAYPSTTYGHTWWGNGTIEPVGLVFNAVRDEGGAETAARLASLRARGPVLALFTGSHVGVQREIHEALVQLAARALSAHPSLHLVIKPKPAHTAFLQQSPCADALRPFLEAGRITILDPSGSLWCSAQTLLRHASVAVTYGGSVVQEALAIGTPIVVQPVVPVHETPWIAAFRGSVVIDDADAALARIGEILSGRVPALDRAVLQQYCDAFLDDGALERLQALVVRMMKAA